MTSNNKPQLAGRATVETSDFDWELDQYVATLEQAYRKRANSSETIELADFLPHSKHPRFSEILRELIRVDMELASESGHPRKIEDYRARFDKFFLEESFYQPLLVEQQRLFPEEKRSPRTIGPTAPCDRYPLNGESLCEFEVICELGRGAFSRVYLALDKGLASRRVALKISSQFPGEAEILSKLQHKNIVPIYSLHRHGDAHLVCMPFYGTTTLAGLLSEFQRTGKLHASGAALVNTINSRASRTWVQPSKSNLDGAGTSLSSNLLPTVQYGISTQILERFSRSNYAQAILWIVAELADGLEHAHQRGVLHRDIKPANVLVTDDGLPMLLDFNLAAMRVAEGQKHEIVGGTLRYMSPEHLREVANEPGRTDQRSDVYSLGVVLFELLNLEAPFPDHGTDSDSLKRMIEDRRLVPTLSLDRSLGITSGSAAIASKALQFNPSLRYQSAGQMRDDILRELENRPIQHALGESSADRLKKWNRRHPSLSASTLVASAAVLIIVSLLTWFTLRQAGIAKLQAENWLARASTARGIAQGLMATSDVPTAQLEEMLSQCDVILQEQIEQKIAHLISARQDEASETAGQLLFFRARGKSKLALRARDDAKSREYFRAALDDLRQVNRYSRQSGPGAELLASNIAHALESTAPLATSLLKVSSTLHQDRPKLLATIEAVRKSMATDASNPWYWLNLGQLQFDAGQRDAALTSLHVATKLDAQLPWIPLLLGTVELDLNHHAQAERLFGDVLVQRSDVPQAHLNRALARIGRGDLLAALEDLDEIEVHAAALPRILFVREMVKRRLGRAKEADADRDAGLILRPTDALSWNARGEARLRLKPPDAQGALEDFRHATELSPGLRNSYENIAHVLSEHLSRPLEAIESLDRAIVCDENYALAWSSRSVLHARLGNSQRAVEDAEAALRIDRSAMICYQAASALAIVRRDDGDEARSLKLLKETVRKEPKLAEFMRGDSDLKNIKDRKELQQIIAAAALLL